MVHYPEGLNFSYPSSVTQIGESVGNERFVDDLVESDCLDSPFAEFMEDYKRSGIDAIVAHFNLFYSAIRQFNAANFHLMVKMFKVLRKEFQQFVEGLPQLLRETLDEDMLRDIRSKVYICVFLLTNFAHHFEDEETRKTNPESAHGETKAGRGRKHRVIRPSASHAGLNWAHEKKRLLSSYCDVLSPGFAKIFESDPSKENMSKAISRLCPYFLNTCDTSFEHHLFELITFFLKNDAEYPAELASKCAQFFSQPEAYPPIFVSLVGAVIGEDFGRRFANHLFNEIAKADSTELANEGADVKNYVNFLTQLASAYPDAIIHGLFPLSELRAKQSLSLRNCILSVYCELAISKFVGEELNLRERGLRDYCLSALLEHMHDRNAHVRSKVLLLWKRLCIEKCIPLSIRRRLVPMASGRLRDKSVIVRKNALQLLTVLLENNPFFVKLSIESIRQKICELSADMDGIHLIEELMNSSGITSDEEADIFHGVRSRAEDAIREVYDMCWKEGTFVPTEQLSGIVASTENLNQDICDVFHFIATDHFEEAVMMMIAITLKFSRNNYFSLKINSDLSLEELTVQVIPILKAFYVGLRAADELLHPSSTVQQNVRVNELPPAEQFLKNQLERGFLEDCLQFANNMTASIAIVKEMLCKNQQLDVFDCLIFMATCAEFGLISRMDDCWDCWNLIWSSQKNVKTAVMCNFRRLYFYSGEEMCPGEEVVNCLTELILRANHENRLTLEKLLNELFVDGLVPKEFSHSCWKVFYTQMSVEKRAALISLAGMMIEADPDVFIEHMGDIIEHGLGSGAYKRPLTAIATCGALKKLGDIDRARVSKRLEVCQEKLVNRQLAPRINRLLSEGVLDDSHFLWVPMMHEAIELIFNVTKRPDVLATELLRSVAKAAFGAPERIRNLCVARLFYLVGEVAVCILRFAEVTMVGQADKVHREHGGDRSDNKSSVSSPQGRSAAAADSGPSDRIKFSIEYILEAETLSPSSVLGQFATIVIRVCKNIDQFPAELFHCAAGTALLKLMLISSKFCSDNCPLLFDLLEKSPYADARVAIALLLPDLFVRYPNQLDCWTDKLFARLSDDDERVRIACIRSTTHLILQDRIKPRSFIASLAICCVDDKEEISKRAKGFFKEYAEKEPLYNTMSFIVQRLSEEDATMEPGKFKALITWLLGLFHRDCELEKIVERFCQLFSSVRSVKYIHNLSYSLTFVKHNDKTVRKLLENVRYYQSKLGEPIVYENFVSIADAASKGANEETKLKLKNWKAELDNWHGMYTSATASQEQEKAE